MDLITGFLISLASGVLASALVLGADRLCQESRLRERFQALQGDWVHENLQRESLNDSRSHITYLKDGGLEITSSTGYGDWHATVKMDPALSAHGAGTFTYTDSVKGTGVIEIVLMPGGNRILVSSTALDFVGYPPAVYWWVRPNAPAPI